MKLLLISTIQPYPKKVGKTVVLGGFCDYFIKNCLPGNFHILCFEPIDSNHNVKWSTLEKPSFFQKMFNLLYFSLLKKNKSLQESFFWSSKTLDFIEKKINEFNPDVVLFDTIRTGQYLLKIKNKTFKSILYMDDLFSIRYQRIAKAMDDFPDADIDAIGNFSINIPGFLQPIYHRSSSIKRTLLKIEQELVEKSENCLPAHFDLALLISKDEVNRIKKRIALENIFSVSPLISRDTQNFTCRSWTGRPEFVFLGSLNLAHNAFSIEHFIERHMNDMVAAMPECILRIIGSHPSKNLLQLADKYNKNIIIEGFVDDLDTTLSNCAAMIAPLVFGSGVKIKMIDAVRLRVPVVSTSYGAEGISLKEKGGIIIEDNLSLFPSLCLQLLNIETNMRHSTLSHQIYLDNYSNEAIQSQYKKFFCI